jgi:hypothetical protein
MSGDEAVTGPALVVDRQGAVETFTINDAPRGIGKRVLQAFVWVDLSDSG